MGISLVKEHAASTSVLKMETACSSEVWYQPTWLQAWFQASIFEVAEKGTLLGYYMVSSGKLRNNQEERSSVPDYMICNPEGYMNSNHSHISLTNFRISSKSILKVTLLVIILKSCF